MRNSWQARDEVRERQPASLRLWGGSFWTTRAYSSPAGNCEKVVKSIARERRTKHPHVLAVDYRLLREACIGAAGSREPWFEMMWRSRRHTPDELSRELAANAPASGMRRLYGRTRDRWCELAGGLRGFRPNPHRTPRRDVEASVARQRADPNGALPARDGGRSAAARWTPWRYLPHSKNPSIRFKIGWGAFKRGRRISYHDGRLPPFEMFA